jgi:subtilase family serine protease
MSTRACVLSVAMAMLLMPLAAAVASTTKAPASPAMVRIPGHVLSVLSHAAQVNQPVDSRGRLLHDSDQLTTTIVLKHDDQAGFDRYLKDLYDPHSKNFHHYLKQREIARRFGPSRQTYDATLAYLRANGFKLVEGAANRLTLTVRGTRAGAERAFGVRIADYRIDDRRFYANNEDPALPAGLASRVESITGLTNFPQPQNTNVAIAAIVCSVKITFGFAGPVFNQLYLTGNPDAMRAGFLACVAGEVYKELHGGENIADPPPPAWIADEGTGQNIGLIEFDSYQTSDVADFLNLAGVSNMNNLTETKVGRSNPWSQPGRSVARY